MQRSRERSAILWFVAASVVVLAVYAAVLTHIPLDVFWHPDEGAKYIGMRSVHWDGRLSYSLVYPGSRLDPKYHFYPATGSIYPTARRDGSIEFHWPIFFALASRPAYDAFGMVGIYLLPILSGWLVATLAGVWTYCFRPGAAALAVLLAGLATPVAFYSVSFFEHTPTTLLAGLGLTILILRPGRPSSLLLMVPFLAAAVALRFEMIAFALAMLATWVVTALAKRRWQPPGLLRSRGGPWLRAAALLAIIVVLGVLLAGAIPRRHLQVLQHIPQLLHSMWFKRNFFLDSLVRIFLGGVSFTDINLVRVWQIAAFMALGGLIVGPFADTRRMEAMLVLPSLFVLLQTSLVTVMNTLPFLQRQGVLTAAPFIGISLCALPEAWKRRDNRLLALACAGGLYAVFGFLALYATRVAEHDGGSLLGLDGGVRYMLTLYPLGAALAVLALLDYRASDAPPLARSAFSAMVVGLMLVSFYYEYLGLRELARKREVLVQWREELMRQEPVVTDLWWLPAVLAPYWVEHEMYVVPYAKGLGEWLTAAASHGVGAFTYASTRPIKPAVEADSARLEAGGAETVLDLNVARFNLRGPAP